VCEGKDGAPPVAQAGPSWLLDFKKKKKNEASGMVTYLFVCLCILSTKSLFTDNVCRIFMCISISS
jgi:hypothetical protein